MTPRHLLPLAVALVLAVTVAGCGGDEESASEQWAGDVCSELSTWATSVGDAITTLTDNPLSIDQASVQAATADVKTATDDLVDGLGDLEPVETEAGNQARTELNDLVTELQQQLDQVEQESDSGSLSIVTVTAALSTASSAVKSTFESLQSIDSDGELRDGFENADACDSLRDQVDTIGN